eukprot:TRINITY_DN2178_c0_g1_i2.p2 TRINITY_DN2178_c0_g1~~TRINITY_DN2178_c0_g1_i2.p2  ORF type:complete len:296 (+),score=62.93 TRINITY_DN2178_c0_g1_i2:54-890(+)
MANPNWFADAAASTMQAARYTWTLPETSFHFDGRLLASSIWVPLTTVIVYNILVFCIPKVLPRPITIAPIQAVHNAFLTILSAFMAYKMYIAASDRGEQEGVWSLVCGARPAENLWDGPVGWIGYVFYLSKYLELLDTLFIVLKKRSPIFLHQWHHTAVLMGAWQWFAFPWVEGSSWCVFVNSIIHVIMYAYYFLASVGSPPKAWSHYVTQLQIVQFMTGNAVVFTWLYLSFTQGCTSNLATGLTSLAINFSFLGLFIKMYVERRRDRVAKRAASKSK